MGGEEQNVTEISLMKIPWLVLSTVLLFVGIYTPILNNCDLIRNSMFKFLCFNCYSKYFLIETWSLLLYFSGLYSSYVGLTIVGASEYMASYVQETKA